MDKIEYLEDIPTVALDEFNELVSALNKKHSSVLELFSENPDDLTYLRHLDLSKSLIYGSH